MYIIPKEISSLIKGISYNYSNSELYLEFHTWLEPMTYINVPHEVYLDLVNSNSLGKFYLTYIKPIFKTKKQKQKIMADKIIKISLDVTKINKDWLFVGKKNEETGVTPMYLNLTLLYNEQQDKYGRNGFIVQDVPKEVYKADKTKKGEILGNCKDFTDYQAAQSPKPGEEVGTMAANSVDDIADDLPF